VLLLDTSFLVDYEAEIEGDKIGPARRMLRSRPREAVAISIISLGENDAWIAATALAYHAELAGRERAFSRVPRLKYTAI
jgi:predicted nucleic acid-binding protein